MLFFKNILFVDEIVQKGEKALGSPNITITGLAGKPETHNFFFSLILNWGIIDLPVQL